MNKTFLSNKYFIFISIAIIFLIHTIYLSCIAEDSFITYRFAQNLANGHGFIWNIGEAPIEGFTNFLWLVICSVLIKLGAYVPLSSQIIGVLFSLGTMWITHLFASKIMHMNQAYSFLPVLFLGCSGPFSTWATSGMETNMFGFFILLACYFYALYWKTNQCKHLKLGFFILFPATLTRPEGFMIFALMIGLSALLIPEFSKKTLQNHIFGLAFYVIPFSVYFLWRYDYFGFPLPNTFYAKTGGGIDQHLRGLVHALYFYSYFILPFIIPVLVYLILRALKVSDFFSFSAPGFDIKQLSKHIKKYIGMYQCLLIACTYTAYIIYVGGDYMAMFRFFVPILPMLYLIIGYGLVNLNNARTLIPNNKTFNLSLLCSILVILIQSTPFEQKLFPAMPFNHGTYRGVKFEQWHATRLSVIGKYFNSIKNNYHESLATGGIGATGYYADMRIFGLHGLVDTFLAHKKFAPGTLGKGLPGHERGDLAYIFSKKPTYFMFSRYFSKQPSEVPDKLQQEIGDIIDSEYKLTSVWLEDSDNHNSGYFTYLKRI